jgi:two-component system aerobic respiration control sensor histidine kinase ArcB
VNCQSIFDLCLNFSENIFLALSKDFLIVNASQAMEEILNCKKCEFIHQNVGVLFKQKFLCDFPKILSLTKKTSIATTYVDNATNEKIAIVWDIVSLPENVRKNEVAFWVIGKLDNHFTKKQQEELKFYNLVKYAPGLFYWKDKDSVYQGCNNEFAKFAGLTSRFEVEGKTDHEFPWQERADDYIKVDQEVIKTGVSHLNHEETVATVDGKVRSMITNKVPLLNSDNQIIGLLGITTDITHQKKAENDLRIAKEEAEVASRAKTEFLENMRHDIRTPLMGITGFADILKNEATDPKIKVYADNLIASSYSLLDLLNGVLEAIKVSSGEIPFLKKKFDLKEKLNNLILLNQAKAQQKKLELLFECDENIPDYLLGDPVRMQRIVLELITNALNFTDKGYVKLSACLAKDNESDAVIKIVVEDTGIGIEKEKQQEIYLQFKRLTPSYEGIYKGFGLGLSIAKQFINDMEGELYVESKVGSGSIFTFVIKLKKPLLADDALGSEDIMSPSNGNTFVLPLAPQMPEQIAETTAGYKSRILLVEDSALAAQVVVKQLSAMDCIVDLAENGKRGLELAEKNQYDLIFMDIGLPDINGYEVTKRIRLSELKKPHVPIIALTAHAGEENKKKCIDIGMNAVLTKPLPVDQAEDILNFFIPYRRDKLNLGKPSADLEVMHMFLENLPEERGGIQAAYEKKDWIAVKELTHKFNGGVSYCAAARLQAACAKLEKAIREEKSEFFEDLYAQLCSEMVLLENQIREKLV